MSKDVFERLFETAAMPVSNRQASFLERSTIVALAFTSFVSIVGVVITLTVDSVGKNFI